MAWGWMRGDIEQLQLAFAYAFYDTVVRSRRPAIIFGDTGRLDPLPHPETFLLFRR